MSQPATTPLRVCLDVNGVAVPAGAAYVSERRGVVSTAFDYDRNYLADRRGYGISPELPLSSGRHHASRMPGAFADSTPDRWGRNLIGKRIRAQARLAGRTPTTVTEVDYLLGVSDLTRQGALRFATDDAGPFLAEGLDVPKMLKLPRLLAAADAVAFDTDEDLSAVKVLLDAGSASLGGARPKASVRTDGNLLIAKFPHPADEWDVMAWEKTALDLAEQADIRVPARRLVDVGGRSVLVLDRFDRTRSGRVGYLSAMTLLRGRDGGSYDYLEVVEAITEHGSAVASDLAELWRRIAFSLVINNTDDHLRNHGFLRESGGWRLSPAFDINPDPDSNRHRVTTIGYTAGAAAGLEALLGSAADFGLQDQLARRVLDEVLAATSNWRQVAAANGLSETTTERFSDALDRFRVS